MEYRRRCNVCGKIYCFSDQDLKDNKTNSAMSAISAIGTIASIFGGTRLDTYALSHRTDRYSDKVVDFTKCPSCNSSDTSFLTDEEWNDIQKRGSTSTNSGFGTKRIEINSNATVDSLLKRTKMFLEEEDWDSAAAYCEQILDVEPECAMAYVYKLMIELKVTEQEKLALLSEPFSDNKMYQKAMRFSDENLRKELEGYNYTIVEQKKEKAYLDALNAFNNARSEQECRDIIQRFMAFDDYKNSAQMIDRCKEKAEVYHKDSIYEDALSHIDEKIEDCEVAIELFEAISGWKDADEQIEVCRRKIEEIKIHKEEERLARERQHEKDKIEWEKFKRKMAFVGGIVAACIVIATIFLKVIIPIYKHKMAEDLIKEKSYAEALDVLEDIYSFMDSKEMYKQALVALKASYKANISIKSGRWI